MEFMIRNIAMRKDLLDCDKAEQIARAIRLWNNPHADDTRLEKYWYDQAYQYIDSIRLM